MWSISELKRNGKFAFKANYWKCVLVAFILSALTASGASGAAGSAGETVNNAFGNPLESLSAATGLPISVIGATIASIVGFGIIVGTLISLFVTNPFIVGCNIFYLDNAQGNAYLGNLIWAYKNNFLNTVIAMLLRSVFTVVGFVLLIVPGIYLSYAFRLVPYVLADHPEMSPGQVLRESMRLMAGHKLHSFFLDFSFIGWYILNIFTLNLLSIFYISPYKWATDAELYRAIRAENRQIF